MAGIGFELRRLAGLRSGLFSKARAYTSAGLISSGPWILTAITLSLVSLGGGFEVAEAGELFRALVTYGFAFSLMTVGSVQMALTRWIADRLYLREYSRILPAYLACCSIVGVFQAFVAAFFCSTNGFAPSTTYLATALYVIISLTWISLIWLTVIREYNQILVSFALGMAVSVWSMYAWGKSGDLDAYLGSYGAGQALTFVLLTRLLVRGMRTEGPRELAVWKSPVQYRALLGTGVAYSIGIWIDKLVFWMDDGLVASTFVRYHPLYDTCTFLAYVTVIPALAINLMHLETSFYERYTAYYRAILGHQPLHVIDRKREAMFGSLRTGITQLLRMQGAITAVVVVLAPFVLELLGLPQSAMRLFRLTCLGAFFHVLLLITILVQLYFDLRVAAFASATVFCIANGGLTVWSRALGFEFHGAGYAAASLISVVVAYVLLDRRLRWLEFETFASQLRPRPE
ncbi:MAG: exopolysaccharide Pel transporter PelG [Planctomycetes bacterium]|nr:exopolysaccharide Pel transporter PelG [Planctomycetota bacterium]MCB9917235.1 exopolysaccharide Pel transporter PelG [Planctomycetota bacterium]